MTEEKNRNFDLRLPFKGTGGVILRQATVADAELIADVSRRTFYDTFAPDNTEADMQKFLAEQFTKGKLMLEVGAAGNTFLLVHDGDNVAGYLKVNESSKRDELKGRNAIEIARIYVVKDYIGKGIGKLLMQAALDIARQKEKEVIWLGVWKQNHRAINFYTSWGFEIFAETTFLLGDDLQYDWLMKKDLRER